MGRQEVLEPSVVPAARQHGPKVAKVVNLVLCVSEHDKHFKTKAPCRTCAETSLPRGPGQSCRGGAGPLPQTQGCRAATPLPSWATLGKSLRLSDLNFRICEMKTMATTAAATHNDISTQISICSHYLTKTPQ